MNKKIRVALAQMDFIVGDIDGNIQKVIDTANKAKQELNASLIVFPELTITGYPPEDLLFRPALKTRVEKALARLSEVSDIAIVLGYPANQSSKLYNVAGVYVNGECIAEYDKRMLPNYDVFDEKRYFTPGNSPTVFIHNGVKFGLNICEDVWFSEPAFDARRKGAEVLISLNASPFHAHKQDDRFKLARKRVSETDIPFIYVNCVGGQDELIFDGGSFAMDRFGIVQFIAPQFKEDLSVIEIEAQDVAIFDSYSQRIEAMCDIVTHEKSTYVDRSTEAEVYDALVLSVRDYIKKNKFKGAVLGLSGGIDSALTATIAADAIGAENVHAVMMPFKWTSAESVFDAEAEAKALGLKYSIISIESMYNAFTEALAPEFEGTSVDTTEENIQARARGVLLMAISNKKGSIVLTTGNKSEMSVGYATLYGDMAGGFNVLKDVPKTLVFRLANYRNSLTPDNPPIPERVITRPPSAELAPDQTDEKSLAPYPILDEILRQYVELDRSARDIINQGFDEADVKKIIRLVDLNEYKRRQAVVGPRLTKRAFGKDRRYPIVNYWKIDD